MSRRMKSMPVEDIDLSDQRFRISFYSPLDQLAQSIEEVGLIYPPIVTRRRRSYVLVTGWKRVLICRQLSMPSIQVFIFEESDDLKCFKIGFFENLTTRHFDLVERAEIVSRLKKFGEEEQTIIQKFLPLLAIPPTFEYYDLYRKISRLSRKEKRFVSETGMDFSVVEHLAKFSPSERKIFYPHLAHLGRNKQKEMLEMTREISFNRDMPVNEIFSDREIKNTLDSEKLSPYQKADNICLALKKMRFPSFSTREESFLSSKKRMKWPRDIDLSPAPFFEDSEAYIKFSFSDQEDYIKKISALRRMVEKEDFSSLIKAVSDE